jgi:hypothetical protein
MYVAHAKSLEEQGKFRDAEKLYLFVSEPDMAISMYKKQHQYDQVSQLLCCQHWDQVIFYFSILLHITYSSVTDKQQDRRE